MPPDSFRRLIVQGRLLETLQQSAVHGALPVNGRLAESLEPHGPELRRAQGRMQGKELGQLQAPLLVLLLAQVLA
jgi:hypothetical protein